MLVKTFQTQILSGKNIKKKLDALCEFHKKVYGNSVAYFDTNSCAEFHWKPLHEMLIKYHIAITNESEEKVRENFLNDGTFRHTLLMKNNHIVTHYFDTRLLNYLVTVGIELFDFYDNIIPCPLTYAVLCTPKMGLKICTLT